VHTIILPAVTIWALHAHRAKQEEERLLAGTAWKDTGFVFTTSIGTPLDARSVIRRFHSVLIRAKLPHIRFHDLRHSAASLLLDKGVSPRYISDLLGHSQVSFTMQTYAHVLPQAEKRPPRWMKSWAQGPLLPRCYPARAFEGELACKLLS